MVLACLECGGKGNRETVCSSSWNQWRHWFPEEQEILKLRPRDTHNTEKNVVGFHIMSLIWIDRDEVENEQSCPLMIDQFQQIITAAKVINILTHISQKINLSFSSHFPHRILYVPSLATTQKHSLTYQLNLYIFFLKHTVLVMYISSVAVTY